MDKSEIKSGRLLYGGSFNPIHIGHLRLALEVLRMLRAFIQYVDFIPVACPPHKKSSSLLPFNLRAELIRLSIANIPGLECNVIEEFLPRPSYSEQTIKALASARPEEELYFLLGSSDFILLPEWKNGLDLPKLCNLVVAPRGELDFAGFVGLAEKNWPGNVIIPQNQLIETNACGPGKVAFIDLTFGGRIFFLPVPYLDISATYIRNLWLCGGNIDFLMPNPALNMLDRERKAVEACWRRTD